MQESASAEVAKKWKLRGKRNSIKSTSAVLKAAVPMDGDLQSCLSGIIQTSGTDDSKGPDFRDEKRTPPRRVRPGRGGYRPQSPVSFRGRSLALTSNRTSSPFSPPSYHSSD
jgi:hypothetical protein